MKLLSFAALCLCAVGANATTLAYWNFNDASSGSVPAAAANVGTGTWTTNAISNTAAKTGVTSFGGDSTNPNALNSDPAGQALAIQGGTVSGSTENNGKYVQFNTSASGYKNIVLSYNTRGTTAGFSSQKISYSTDGVNFTDFTTITGRNVTPWAVQSVDLSSISALTNASKLSLRVTLDGATAYNGNNRFDNVQINGVQAVPEPASMLALGLGLAAVIRRRNRR